MCCQSPLLLLPPTPKFPFVTSPLPPPTATALLPLTLQGWGRSMVEPLRKHIWEDRVRVSSFYIHNPMSKNKGAPTFDLGFLRSSAKKVGPVVWSSYHLLFYNEWKVKLSNRSLAQALRATTNHRAMGQEWIRCGCCPPPGQGFLWGQCQLQSLPLPGLNRVFLYCICWNLFSFRCQKDNSQKNYGPVELFHKV